jgi:hypothetical protein
MRPIGGALDLHDAEFDEVVWMDVPEALALMSHATERSVVEEASGLLAARPGSSRSAAASEAEATA